MKITIDSKSGCCPGVKRALKEAESILDDNKELYCLGAIVHNNTELSRLAAKGLKIISYQELSDLKSSNVLIRAHGEPPSTYQLAVKNGLNIIDCTCPVVLQLQKKIRSTYNRLLNEGGQIIIFGKHGHAEVNGLVGQTDSKAIVVENIGEIDSNINSGTIDVSKHTAIFSQTTKDPDEYKKVINYLSKMVETLDVYDTICTQVTSRHKHLIAFASQHSIIFFVSGKESSNGKLLFELCKSVNKNTYLISSSSDIDLSLIKGDDTIGICGATSTPKWQLEAINKYLSKFLFTFAD